ncbi:MAG: zinc ribbon domain-containing protein [Oscillospiraceae bacterium]
MFCPRCGRPVSETANFCGGCGLPKAEILRLDNEKKARQQTPPIQPTPVTPPVDIGDINDTINKLNDDLNGMNVTYTPDAAPSAQPPILTTEPIISQEIKEELKTELSDKGINPSVPQLKQEDYDDSGYAAQVNPAPKEVQTPPFDAYTRQSSAQNQYSNTTGTSYGVGGYPSYPQAGNRTAQEAFKGEQNLSTVDFVWMMLISAIPFVGFFYLLYLAFVQDNNVNKRSYSRACLIVSIFMSIIGIVFVAGIIGTQFLLF